jgi:hypothetical protein
MMLKIIDGGRSDPPKMRSRRPFSLLRKRRLTIGRFGSEKIATTGRLQFTVRDGR